MPRCKRGACSAGVVQRILRTNVVGAWTPSRAAFTRGAHGVWGNSGVEREGTLQRHEEPAMLHYAIVFLVIAVIAALFGFTGIAGTAAWIAKVLFVIFLVLAVIAFFRRSS